MDGRTACHPNIPGHYRGYPIAVTAAAAGDFGHPEAGLARSSTKKRSHACFGLIVTDADSGQGGSTTLGHLLSVAFHRAASPQTGSPSRPLAMARVPCGQDDPLQAMC